MITQDEQLFVCAQVSKQSFLLFDVQSYAFEIVIPDEVTVK